MQPASSTPIPDGLLAAMALLSENSRLGFERKNPALHPGHNPPNFTGSIGDSWSIASETRWGHEMGRFLSPDWNNDPEPVPWADFSDPQSLNLYSYVGNNPLSHEDPDGHMCDGGSTDANGVFTFHCSNERPQKAMDQGAVNPGDLGLGAYAFGRVGEIAVRGVISGVSSMIGRELPAPAPKGGLGPVLQGLVGVDKAVAEIEAEGGTVVAKEVTVVNSAGRARVDVVYRDSSGELKFGEAKNGPTAALNPNQQAVYGAMEKEGAKLVGGNAATAGLPLSVSPTAVRVFKY